MLINELPGQESQGKSTGDKFERFIKVMDLFVKLMAAGGVAVLIWYLGSRAEDSRQKIAEANRTMAYRMEFSAKQKDLDVNLSMRMFETLLGNYLQKDGKGGTIQEQIRKQLLLLRLIALNFQDVPINLKPIFEDLDRQLTTPEEKKELRNIALELARRQAYRLTVENGDLGEIIKVSAGQEVPKKDLKFTLKINEIDQDSLKASLVHDGRTFGPFTVSIFSMPIVDNIKIAASRVCLLPLMIDGNEATVRLIIFPSELAADRFDLKELTMDERNR